MSRQYKRSYELRIIPEGEDARVITGLRIAFEITKSLLSFPNLAEITIYNPNATTIAALQKRYTKVELKAGYDGNEKLIFKGEIRNVIQKRQSVDRLITFYAGDGEKDWQNSNYNKTFTEDVNVKDVITDVLSSFANTATGAIEGLPDIVDKLRGQTLSGSSSEILDMFADEYDFEWSIQDEELVITSDDAPLSSETYVVIKPTTGMIGTPTVTEIGADVTALLNPDLLPNRGFTIASETANINLGNLYFRDINATSANGSYKIMEAKFKGDTHDGEWVTIVKGRALT